MGLADFAHEIPRILDENGVETTRATIGKAQVLPGAVNTVPGNVEFSLDFRDPDENILQDLSNAFQKALSAIARRRKLRFHHTIQSTINPVLASPEILRILESQAKDLSLRYRNMTSGAAHDAQQVAQIAPVAMVFVPSKKGYSHSPAEWTSWDDVEAGANLMLRALLLLSNKSPAFTEK